MCGRTACTLAPDDIVRACTFRNRQGRHQRPVWKDAPGGQQYYPSYNIAPASHTPVLVSSKHFPELETLSERVVQPMKWGLVPKWHKGDPNKLDYETNNCRAEGMLTKKTYKTSLERGNRCVILADGFFEWKRSKEGKQPYFIYFPQDSQDQKPADVKPGLTSHPDEADLVPHTSTERKTKRKATDIKPDRDSSEQPVKTEPQDHDQSHQTIKNESDDNDDTEWTGKRLLTMAGVFEIWHPADGSEPMYSYSVITVNASPAMAWIHNRMPAILSSDEEIHNWLEYEEVPLAKAVQLIVPKECITSHMVSSVVNNSRNKAPECIELYNPKEVKKTASSNLMMNWLNKAKPSPRKEQTEPDIKKPKLC